MKTPSFSHFTSADYEHVYEPSEDTFLMLDALENDLPLLTENAPSVCLEIGSGSGCVSTFLGFLWPHAYYLASDINPHAARATKLTGFHNAVPIDPVLSSFATGFGTRLHHNVDVLIFNPPYVVTPSSEVGSHGIEAAWAGGVDGREVLDAFLPQIEGLLSEKGLFYLVTVRENRPLEIMQHMKEVYGLFSKWVASAQANNCSTNTQDYLQIYNDLSPWYNSNLPLSLNSTALPAPPDGLPFVSFGTFRNGTFSHNPDNLFTHLIHLLPPEKLFQYILSNIDSPVVLPSDDGSVAPYETVQDTLDHNNCLRSHYPSETRSLHGFFLAPHRFYTQNTLLPLFSRAKLPSCYKDILLPGEYHISEARKLQHFADPVAWESKHPVLFWRGSTTGGRYTDETPWKQFHRTRLLDWEAEFAGRLPDRVCDVGKRGSCSAMITGRGDRVVVDVGIHAASNMDLGFIEKHRVHKMYPYKSYVSHLKTMKNKYLLVVDGNSWPGRLQWYLGSNSVVLYNGIFVDYMMGGLEAWRHYVPVAMDFSDLQERLEWLESHDAEARQISQNAQEYVKRFNSVKSMECYSGLLFLEYSRLYS
ncbi:HemK methyltransferase member 2 [Podochytrium sp. JEL0797]|nr:HemK methyltransferase member 2 [Podochytrium sp. JEL0797]